MLTPMLGLTLGLRPVLILAVAVLDQQHSLKVDKVLKVL